MAHFKGTFPDVLGLNTPGFSVALGSVTEVELDAVRFEVTPRLRSRPVEERDCLLESEGDKLKLKDGVKYS